MPSRIFYDFDECYASILDLIGNAMGTCMKNLSFTCQLNHQPLWLRADKKRPWVNHRLILEYTDWILSGDVEPSDGLLREIVRAKEVPQRYVTPTSRGQRIDDQIDDVVDELYFTPDSRRAQISLLNGEDQEVRKARRKRKTRAEYPATIAMGYYIENSELNSQVVCSSCDFKHEFPMEAFLQSVLSMEIAERLELKVGPMHWFFLDSHIGRG